MNLVFIPFHDWKKCEREGFRTRDAHFMQEFSNSVDVNKLLIINRPTSIAEVLLFHRNWRSKRGQTILEKNGFCLKQVSSKTYVLDILVTELIRPFYMKRSWIPYIFDTSRTVSVVQQVLEYLKIDKNFSVMTSAPLYVPLVAKLKPTIFTLDAQDNLLKHSLYRNVPQLAEHYSFCQANADLITTNSWETAQWLGKNRDNVFCIPNGVDAEIFKPLPDVNIPDDLKSLSHPIVGYAGKMQEMFDVSLMEYVVSKLPNVNFVFIGQQLNPKWMAPLWRYPNVHYLGDKHYERLPQYLATFDICTIPYNLERQHSVDPIKFYEYLAMGKPIVTTNVGNVKSFFDYPQVQIASEPVGFLEGINFFLNHIKGEVPIIKHPVPQSALWKTKAQEITTIMNTILNSK